MVNQINTEIAANTDIVKQSQNDIAASAGDKVTQLQTTVFVTTVVAFVLFILASVTITGFIVKPLKGVAVALEDIADGDGDQAC